MIHTLESILVPGKRSRISPYVEDAQLQVLFGQMPDAIKRYDDIRRILNHNQEEMDNLKETYIQFSQAGRRFEKDAYLTEKFLRLYLSYYFLTNISKIQLCLLDLVRENKIAGNIHIMDIGVGSGTTAVAVLDFLLAWGTSCFLYDHEFPIESVTIKCYDCSPVCLNMAKTVTNNFCDSVLRRRTDVFGQKRMAIIMDNIVSWGNTAEWLEKDISSSSISSPADKQKLLFASNVLSELPQAGKDNLAETIFNMSLGSIAVIIEPGDRNSCNRMNQWKVNILQRQKGISSLLPCKEIVNESCSICWNSRRESMHESLLFRKLRERIADDIGDQRGFDDYTNNLLSWSYAILERSNEVSNLSIQQNVEHLTTRVMGTLIRRAQNEEWMNKSHEPDEQQPQSYVECIKLCPSATNRNEINELWGKRTPGFFLPPLRHGDQITITNHTLRQHSQNKWILDFNLETEIQYSSQNKEVNNKSFLKLKEYTENSKEAVDEIAFRLFGFKTMRSFQHEILSRVLTGNSILGIAATGGGKSECYILPAMLFPGVTIVVSPLKSLMQDQYEKRLDERYGLRNLSTYINGDISFKERQARLKRMELGYYKLVYFTPEQLRQTHVLNALKRTDERIGIRYFALDEAHCISQWGHDFRDSYLNLVTRFDKHGIKPIRIALTATASPEVRKDLCEELGLRNELVALGGDVYIHSSNRSELNLIVKPVSSTDDKVRDIIDRLQVLLSENEYAEIPGAAIVFMPHTGIDPDSPSWYMPKTNEPTKGKFSAGVTSFASYLERHLETYVNIYHSKMDSDNTEVIQENAAQLPFGNLSGRSRRTEQNSFIEGKRSIMVATKGFGMGIDKSNIRLIIHRTPTSNLEAYAQEAGRAGRDGEISDVVLYYSPDAPDEPSGKSKSDHQIQEFFLNQKYIRREDAIAMRKFLLTVRREVCDHLYFTSDEILPFFEQLERKGEYTWVKFPDRLQKAYESDDHKKILDRGYDYNQKIQYIDRILSALYRIRPDIDYDVKRCSLVSSVQETGAVIKCHDINNVVLDAKGIVNANTYYGKLFREKKITPEMFTKWIKHCVENDAVEFAKYIGLSLGETVSMLWDINKSEGRLNFNRWQSSFLNFYNIVTPKYGYATGRDTPALWREYAGASKRAYGYNRAEEAFNRGETREIRNGRPYPTLDDWFGVKELTQPKGWEVLPGSALKDENLFEKYLDKFMELHDQRMVNDRAAYNLLLTDYVGVNEDGTLPDYHKQKEKSCLRAVLLGYLKTGEIVLGNCRSCSRCVPDEKFERDMSKRDTVVERLGTNITDLLDALENLSSELPSADKIRMLWEHVEEQETLGKSLRAYVEGWTGRLLTDTPNHRTAIWIRVDGMMKGFITMQPHEACSRAIEILDTISDNEIKMIWETILLFKEKLPELPESLAVRAIACHRMKQFEEEKQLWLCILEKTSNSELKHSAHSALSRLYSPDGQFSDSSKLKVHSIEAARTAKDFKTAMDYYVKSGSTWTWENIRHEIIHHKKHETDEKIGEKLFAAWIKSQSGIENLATASSNDWKVTIDKLQDIFSFEDNQSYSLVNSLSTFIEKWSSDQLENNPNLCPVMALRIALIANGRIRKTEDFIQVSLNLLNHMDNEEYIEWLSELLKNSQIQPDVHVRRIIMAEIAYLQNNPTAADEYWRTYLEEPAPEVPTDVFDHIITRLIQLHKSDSVLPDQECLSKALTIKARNTSSLDEAINLYKETAANWNWSRVYEELQFCKRKGAQWILKVVELWISLHPQPDESLKVLEELSIFEKKTLDDNKPTLKNILENVRPISLVNYPLFLNMRIDELLKVKQLKESDLEFVVSATVANRIDFEKASSLNIGYKVFYDSKDSIIEKLTNDYANECCDQVKSGQINFFFHSYQPASGREFDGWLAWFAKIKSQNSDIDDRIKQVAENVLKITLEKTKAEIEYFISSCQKHDVEEFVNDFKELKTTRDIIISVEKTTEVSNVSKLDSLHLSDLKKAISKNKSELHKDIVVNIFKIIRENTQPRWLTPLKFFVEALIDAGRLDEANQFQKNEPNLKVKYVPCKWVQRMVPVYDNLIYKIAKAYMKTWNFMKQ